MYILTPILKYKKKMSSTENLQYFKGTITLKNAKQSPNAIKEFKENELLLKREYINKENNGYTEILYEKEDIFTLERVPKNVTLLFSSKEYKEKKMKKSQIIGYRFYNKDNNYFTLVKNIKEDEYIILEKIKNFEFYDEELDCLKIMEYLINDKYSKCDYPSSEQSLLILGFTYAISGNKYNIEILPLLYYTLKINLSNFIQNLTLKKTYLLPISYSSHVSLLLIDNNKNEKKYLLFDPSQGHCINNNSLITRINQNIFQYLNIKIFYDYIIQEHESCSLWLYGHLIYLSKIDNVNYDNIININKNQFLLGIIKEISVLINKPIPIIKKYDINDDNYIKIDCVEEYYIHSESFLSFFLNLQKFISFYLVITVNESKNPFLNEMFELQKIYAMIVYDIYIIEQNKKFFDFYNFPEERKKLVETNLIHLNNFRNNLINQGKVFLVTIIEVNNTLFEKEIKDNSYLIKEENNRKAFATMKRYFNKKNLLIIKYIREEELISIENINSTINYGNSKFLYTNCSKKFLNYDDLYSRPNDKEAEIMFKLIDNEITSEEYDYMNMIKFYKNNSFKDFDFEGYKKFIELEYQ